MSSLIDMKVILIRCSGPKADRHKLNKLWKSSTRFQRRERIEESVSKELFRFPVVQHLTENQTNQWFIFSFCLMLTLVFYSRTPDVNFTFSTGVILASLAAAVLSLSNIWHLSAIYFLSVLLVSHFLMSINTWGDNNKPFWFFFKPPWRVGGMNQNAAACRVTSELSYHSLVRCVRSNFCQAPHLLTTPKSAHNELL